MKILHLIFIVGGAYFIGPDIFSRNFTSESAPAAKKATFKAGAALLLFSLVITLTGMGAAVLSPAGFNGSPYFYIIKNLAGTGAGIIIALGLLSAIISSTDTCLVTASAIFEKDILGKTDIKATRMLVLITGAASLLLALYRKDILSLLIGTSSVFSPGVVIPVFVSIMAKGKRQVNKFYWLTAVIAGGSLGIASGASGKEYLSLAGMAVSAVFSFLSIIMPAKKKTLPAL
jgi:solute:Na+ symporter, SSS family